MLSVIIPVFNRPRQVLLALDSVVSQRDFADQLEIIVVDDHSTPPVSLSELAGWKSEGGPVKLLKLATNSGPAAARNAGILAASGELIAFLDSDDVWLPGKAARQVALLNQVTAAQPETLHAVTSGFYHPNRLMGRLQGRIPYPASRLAEFTGGCWFSPGSTLLLHKDVFSQVGLFDERLRCLEDLDWFIRFGRLGGRLHVVPHLDVIVFRHVPARRPMLGDASDVILGKFGPSGSMQLGPAQYQRLKAYLYLERSSAELHSGSPLQAVLATFTSLCIKIRPRLRLDRHWKMSRFVPNEIRQTYKAMAAHMPSKGGLNYEWLRPQSGHDRLNLLFCIKGMSSPGGGAERVLADVANGLAQRGHRITILTFDTPGKEPYYQLHPSIEKIELGIGSIRDPSTLVVTLRRISALRFEVKRGSPDIVIGFMHSMFIPLALSLIRLPIPLVASEHTVYQHYVNRRLQALLLYFVPSLADLTVCVSEQVRATYPPFVCKRMVVVPNPVNIVVGARADVLAHSRKRKLLLAVGRLDAGKDHATLIDAFAQIAGRCPDWDLRIVGEGELRPKLHEQIAALGLAHRVRLPGTTRNVSKEYQNAQLFVMPSRYESFSLTTAEALAHGLPVIGFSDCPGVNQFVRTHENGVLVEPRRDRATCLASALLPLMEKAELRGRLKAGSDFPEECRLDRVIDKWESIVRSIVAEKSLVRTSLRQITHETAD